MSQQATTEQQPSFPIRPPMRQCVRHALQCPHMTDGMPEGSNNTSYSTHTFFNLVFLTLDNPDYNDERSLRIPITMT
jgi:hypothetical protein